MQSPNFTKQEWVFITNTFKFSQDIFKSNPQMAYSLLEKALNNKLKSKHEFITHKAMTLMESLLFKVAEFNINAEIDKLLKDPSYASSTPPSKSQKISKLTKGMSYDDVKRDFGNTLMFKVYDQICTSSESLSRSDLSKLLGMKLSSVCARVKELLDAGLIHQDGIKTDYETNKKVSTLTAPVNSQCTAKVRQLKLDRVSTHESQ